MHEAPKDIRRRIIPRWRRLSQTPSAEISSVRQSSISSELNREFSELKTAWRDSHDVATAAELLYAASLGLTDETVHQAAQLLIDAKGVAPELKRLAASKLPEVPAVVTEEVEHKQQYEIKTLKAKLVEYPRNAVAHIEVARAYVSLGQLDKAQDHVRTALHLAPTNRFILRSAARFDVHRGQTKRSIRAIEGVAAHDPWLAATLISVADLSDEPIKRIKPLRELLERTSDPAEKSELAAALGTLELKHTGLPKARKLFQISALAPNENVVAQLFWLSKNYGVNFDKSLLSRDEAFEALAHSSADASNWGEAVRACLHWMDNEPFAIRPAYEGGFIASEMLGDYKAAKEFAHRGLTSNPKAAGLMNNLAYAEIMEGELVAAKELILRAKSLISPNEEREKAVLQATEGLLHYREGNPDAGARLYTATVLKARELNNEKLLQLAYIHFCYEELRIGHAPPFWAIEDITKFFESEKASKEAKIVFKRLVVPMLVARQKYGLVGSGYHAPLPISAPEP